MLHLTDLGFQRAKFMHDIGDVIREACLRLLLLSQLCGKNRRFAFLGSKILFKLFNQGLSGTGFIQLLFKLISIVNSEVCHGLFLIVDRLLGAEAKPSDNCFSRVALNLAIVVIDLLLYLPERHD